MNYYYGGYGPYGQMLGYDWFGGIFHVIWVLLGVALLLWVIRLLFGGGRRMRHYRMWQMHSAMNILDERFAKGEIDKAEYEEKKKALMN